MRSVLRAHWRDFWLIVATGLVAYSVIATVGAVAKINNERAHNALTTCVDTDMRYRNAVAALDTLYAPAKAAAKTDQERQRLELSQQGTLRLINALVPYTRDCQAKAARQVHQ